ncbi:MAG: hypothetical protein IPK83_12505 [Planctomycetes bacterium]|nr:hypothetical protein [Planctomycetota bacterium]
MLRRAFSFGLAFALLAPPVLCMGGVLLHECRAACCDCKDACETAKDDGCGHESQCASDPCKDLVRSSAKQFESTDELLQTYQLVFVAFTADCAVVLTRASLSSYPADYSGASPPTSDLVLPLLI